MRNILYITMLLLVTTMSSCGEKKLTPEEEQELIQKFLAEQYVKETGEFEISKTYPFSAAIRVEIISYPGRFNWDTLHNSSEPPIAQGKIVIESKIKERINLTTKQKVDMFNLLFNTKCNLPTSAGCYDPRHSLIFYDKDGNAFAFIEICLECYATKESENIKIGGMCDEKIADLRNMFRDIGIKYGLDGEDY